MTRRLLASAITVPELMQAIKIAFSLIRRIWGVLARYFTRHLRRGAA